MICACRVTKASSAARPVGTEEVKTGTFPVLTLRESRLFMAAVWAKECSYRTAGINLSSIMEPGKRVDRVKERRAPWKGLAPVFLARTFIIRLVCGRN